MFQVQHGGGNLPRLRTRQPHHAYAAAAGGRGDGNDGIVQVHRFILTGWAVEFFQLPLSGAI